MLRRIDVRVIVRDHIGTLTDYRTGRRYLGDYVLFFVAPIVAAALLLWQCVLLNATIANIVITSLAIFAGLLFNLLLLAHGMIRSTPPDGVDEKRLIVEIYSNISYAILVSLAAIVVSLISYISPALWFVYSASALAHFLVLNFLLTLLMILRRIHILLSKEFGRA
jgi:hypothetical protein